MITKIFHFTLVKELKMGFETYGEIKKRVTHMQSVIFRPPKPHLVPRVVLNRPRYLEVPLLVPSG